MSNPQISIITPILNGAKYLAPTVLSVLEQEYSKIEHVFVDGGSTDGSVELLREFEMRHPGRIVVATENAPGCGAAWNKGLRISKGAIIGWLGADDLLEKGAANEVTRFFFDHPGAYFLHGACHYIDADGKVFRTHQPLDFSLTELINDQNFVAWPAAFYRRAVIDRVGPLDAYGNDFDYVIRIAKAFPIHKTPKVLARFRVHDSSETGNIHSYIKTTKLDFTVSRRHGGRLFSKFGRRYFQFMIAGYLGLGPFIAHMKRKSRSKSGQ